MGFGGKNRQCVSKRPGVPHHPLARWRRHVQRRTWDHVEVSINGVPMSELTAVVWNANLEPVPHPNLMTFDDLVAATEKAINEMMLTKAQMLGLDASMAPTFGYDWAGKMGREAAEGFALGIATPPYCTAAVALPDTGPDLTALVCTLPAGHDDWHEDVTGAKWREDGAGVIVQPVATLPIVTTEVRVKA